MRYGAKSAPKSGATVRLAKWFGASSRDQAIGREGDGELLNSVLRGIENSVAGDGGSYSRHGSQTHKQVYLYSGLNARVATLDSAMA